MPTTSLYKIVNDKVEVAIVGPDTIQNFLDNGWTTDAPDMGDEEEEAGDDGEGEEKEEETEDDPDTKPITVPVRKKKKIKVRG